MRYKKTKLALAALMAASLAACANNANNDAMNGPRNVAYRNPNGPTNVSTGDLVSNPNRFSAADVQRVNNGFITIDQNSYSTTTPSHQFPNTKRVGDGQFWYYSFGPTVKNQPGTVQQPKMGGATPPRASTPATPAPPPAQQQPAGQSTASIGSVAMQVIDLTNKERQKNGLAPLKADPSLSRVAQAKTNDMNAKRYFSHTSPTYGSPFDMMRDFGVTYRTAGENIAMGQPTAQQVVNAWMNSEGHRKNILSPNYTNIGVGFTKTGNYWSQMFIGK